MNSIFTLISAEGTHFEIERQLLTDNCITFAEILGLQTGADAKAECQLQEKEAEVKLLIDVLKGEREEKFTHEELTALLDLQRKYQSRLLRQVLKAELSWCHNITPYEAFILACQMDDLVLAERLARTRVAKKCTKSGGDSVWDARYSRFCRAHLTISRNVLWDEMVRYNSDNHGCVQSILMAVAMACLDGKPHKSPGKLVTKALATIHCAAPSLDPYVERMDRKFEAEVANIRF